MKTTMNWRGNRTTHKKKRVKHKPKIRWQELGFKNPARETASMSMDEIRRQVVMLSSRGLGQGVRARAAMPSGQGSDTTNQGGATRKLRRGATE